jgi:hypothetical protein
MNEKSRDSWRDNFNYNTVIAIFFIILWTVMFILVPYQIAKPKLVLGRSLMGLKPTLFPRLATLGAILLSIWSKKSKGISTSRSLPRSSYLSPMPCSSSPWVSFLPAF